MLNTCMSQTMRMGATLAITIIRASPIVQPGNGRFSVSPYGNQRVSQVRKGEDYGYYVEYVYCETVPCVVLRTFLEFFNEGADE